MIELLAEPSSYWDGQLERVETILILTINPTRVRQGLVNCRTPLNLAVSKGLTVFQKNQTLDVTREFLKK